MSKFTIKLSNQLDQVGDAGDIPAIITAIEAANIFILKVGDTNIQNLLFSNDKGIDVVNVGSSDTLGIGNSNADIINIGRPSGKVNFLNPVNDFNNNDLTNVKTVGNTLSNGMLDFNFFGSNNITALMGNSLDLNQAPGIFLFNTPAAISMFSSTINGLSIDNTNGVAATSLGVPVYLKQISTGWLVSNYTTGTKTLDKNTALLADVINVLGTLIEEVHKINGFIGS